MESSRSKAVERAQRSVQQIVTQKADAFRRATPTAVLGLLAGSALAPLAATLGPGGPAVTAALATVAGGVGTNLLSELVSNALEKARREGNGKGGQGQAEVADVIAQDLSAALDQDGATASQLSAQVIDVLQRLGGFDAALATAPGDLRDHLELSLSEVAQRSDRVIEALAWMRGEQRRQSVLLEEAVDRLRHFSSPGDQVPPDLGPAAPVAPVFVTEARSAWSSEVPLAQRWRAGEVGQVGDRRYLLVEDEAGLLREVHDASRQRPVRQSLARQTLPPRAAGRAYVWLRQGGDGLTRERDLLTRARNAGASRHLPAVDYYAARAGEVTLALSWPTGRDGRPRETAHAYFPPGTLDGWRASLLLAGLGGLTHALQRLHGLGSSHRNLTPEAITVVSDRHFVLRDLGLATVDLRPGEAPGDYQAPEQGFGARKRKVGSATDVYQLAAIAYHLITGRLPSAVAGVPPLRHDGVPESAATVIVRSLASAPDNRPSLAEFRAALQRQR